MIGSFEQRPRLDDLRPPKTPYVLLGIVCLIAIVGVLIYPTLPLPLAFGAHRDKLIPFFCAVGILMAMVFAQLLGGLETIIRDWHGRAWIGNDWVWWSKEPGQMKGEFISHRFRKDPNILSQAKGWRIHLSLGGFRKQSALFYQNQEFTKIRVIKVTWSWDRTSIDSVTIRDSNSNILTMHPSELLDWMDQILPEGNERGYGDALAAMVRATNTQLTYKEEELQKKITNFQKELAAQRSRANNFREIAISMVASLQEFQQTIEDSSRLKKQLEGVSLYERIKRVAEHSSDHIKGLDSSYPVPLIGISTIT